jgi:hypothetical protein
MLARAFLRLCTLEALRPSALLAGDTGLPDYWPTLAGKYVSDSRIDPIDDDINGDERRPLIGVYTEAASLTRSRNPARCFMSARSISCSRFRWSAKFRRGHREPIIDYADTDAATEAQLDALEDQIFWCLHYSPTATVSANGQACRLMNGFEPHRSGEEAIKLARRTVRVPVKVKEACYVADPVGVPADLDRLAAEPEGDRRSTRAVNLSARSRARPGAHGLGDAASSCRSARPWPARRAATRRRRHRADRRDVQLAR